MRVWKLTNYVLADLPVKLIAIGICKPFTTQGAVGYLNYTLSMIIDRLGKNITAETGERILISTNGRWIAPWVLLYGLGEKEKLSVDSISTELSNLYNDIKKLDLFPIAYTLPGYDPNGWGDPAKLAQLIIDTFDDPGFIVNTDKRVLFQIYYQVKGFLSYMLKE